MISDAIGKVETEGCSPAGPLSPVGDRPRAPSSAAPSPACIMKRTDPSSSDETGLKTFSHAAFRAKMILEECYALRGRVRALNTRVKGPVGADTDRNTALPMVFLLGNHSSGKSSFINYVLQSRIQECGVAPTDDKFTVIAGGDEDIDKDGNSLIGMQQCAEILFDWLYSRDHVTCQSCR